MKLLLFRHQLSAEQSVQLDRAVETFHEAQDQIVLVDAGERDLPTYRGRVDFDRDIAPSTERAQLEITATGRRLVDHWFTHTRDGCSVMTLQDWQIAFLEERQDEPGQLVPFPTAAPDAYLLQSLALITFLLLAGAHDSDYLHMATTGCIADLCADKRTRAIKMRAGYVCPLCLEKASAAGVSPIALDAIRSLAECVRALAIGRKPQSRAARARDDDDEWISRASLPDRIRLPRALVEASRRARLSVVVGSGLSLQSDVDVVFPSGAEWDRLPAWGEVPSRLASALKRYRDQDHQPRATDDLAGFLTDMDFFRSSLGENSYYPRAIIDAFAPVVKSAGRANRLVFRLPVRWVLTTNYDLVLNYASPQGTATFTWCEAQQAREFLERAEGASPPLVKIHGCASRPNTVVLTRAEYSLLRNNEAYGSMIRYVFESMTTLFLGFGLNDPLDLDLAMDDANHAGAAQGEKFALLPAARASAVRQRFPHINVIEYDDAEQVPLVIACLIRASTN